MNVKDLKTKYCLEPDDLPNKGGNNVVTIVALESESYDDKSNPRGPKKMRHNLWFRELQLPLRLNNTRLDILGKLLGEETDHWKGRKIALFNGASSSYGKTTVSIFIALEVQDAGPGVHGNPQQLPPAAGLAKPDAPIGEANAERFQLALAEQGAKYDDFLQWLKRVNRPAHDGTIGMDLADLKRSIAPLMQRFLREYAGGTAAAVVANSDAKSKPADEAPATHPKNSMGDPVLPPGDVDDDIPF